MTANSSAAEVTTLRYRLDLTQARFARALGVSIRTVQSWEQGQRRPGRWASEKLAQMAAKSDNRRKGSP